MLTGHRLAATAGPPGTSREAALEYKVLDEVLWLLAASVLVVAVLRRLNLPSIVGYLLVGMALGPRGLGLINSFEDARELAELGVV